MNNTILVIDDERPTLKMFGLFLSVYGYDMLTAENGEEGIEIFRAEKPPIVLTDIKMPGMDGIELLKAIKDRHPDIVRKMQDLAERMREELGDGKRPGKGARPAGQIRPARRAFSTASKRLCTSSLA